MNISTNQFSRKNFNKGINSFSTSLTKSSNVFTKKTLNKGENTWDGVNTAESAYGVDDMFGGADSTYGTTPYGGKSHFALRSRYNIVR